MKHFTAELYTEQNDMHPAVVVVARVVVVTGAAVVVTGAAVVAVVVVRTPPLQSAQLPHSLSREAEHRSAWEYNWQKL